MLESARRLDLAGDNTGLYIVETCSAMSLCCLSRVTQPSEGTGERAALRTQSGRDGRARLREPGILGR